MQEYLKESEKESWACQKAKWNEFDVSFEKFEDLIKKVKRDFMEDFKYIDMCWDYFGLMYQGCELKDFISEMDMCKKNCNVHVKMHFNKPGEKMRDLLKLSSSDGPSCLTMLERFLPKITKKIQEHYPEEDIFVFIPLAIISKFHSSTKTIESYDDDTTYHQEVIDQADNIWLELVKQHYEFFMDFIHSCESGNIACLENTCPVFVKHKNPFLVRREKCESV